MKYWEQDGKRMAYRTYGDTGPWVVMSHSLGCCHQAWEPQVEALAGRYRVLAYDHWGHGASDEPAGQGTLAGLAADAAALMDHLEIETAHFVGISVGGMVGLALAVEAPSRLRSLVAASCAPAMPEAALAAWDSRMDQARAQGLDELAHAAMARWFPPVFHERHPARVAQVESWFRQTRVQGYVHTVQAIMSLGKGLPLQHIHAPTLVMGGSSDVGVPVESLRLLAQAMPNASLRLIQDTGHLPSIDGAEAFNFHLSDFLQRVEQNHTHLGHIR